MSIIEEINQFKKEKSALIIAHYYQEPQIQDIADYVGDSYGMALFARNSSSKIAVICGVRFMAETMKIMNPDKKILLPDLNAGCSLADSCTKEVFEYFINQHDHKFVMTYINSSIEIKALSDVICTSSNAVKIARQVPIEKKIIFGPDQHLGRYIAKQLNREVVLFPGNCFVHLSFSLKEMMKLKMLHPEAPIIAHPECEEAILDQADFIGSTSQLLDFTKNSKSKKFIVMTESGIAHQMRKSNPNKEFILGPDIDGCACNDCPHMKLNTLEKIKNCLIHENPSIEVDAKLAEKALIPLERMVTMAEK